MVEVILLRLAVKPGWPTAFVRALTAVTGVTRGTVVEEFFQRATIDVLEAEGMYTESVFLERREEGGDRLYWYMEADSFERVYDAYHGSGNPVARVSKPVLGRILERPEVVLGPPTTGSDFELVVHGSHPDRPGGLDALVD